MNETFTIPEPRNEPVLSYAPGSPERGSLKAKLEEMRSQTIEIPLLIGGEEVRTGKMGECRSPHDHQRVLARYHMMGPEQVDMAIEAALEARREWAEMPWNHRAAIFLKMADLLAGPWRDTLNAATMLGQSKSVNQAEIDSACEIIDFWRFNPQFMQQVYDLHPSSSPGIWNRIQYRPLEGFVYAVTPFNFTSIAANLPTSPAMMGNVVLWKCARSSVYSAYYLRELFAEAGLPDGVITLMLGSGRIMTERLVARPEFAGLHFTGSTATFQGLWRDILGNLESFNTYPRIVGETGGKDFVFVHGSADVDAVVTALVRGAYEYQGQKCSAASRGYIPESLWPEVKERLLAEVATIKMGDPMDFSAFMNAVIDEAAFDNIVGYIEHVKAHGEEAEIIAGGRYDKTKGYFIEPTVVQAHDPKARTMREEIFGPVLSLHVYPDERYEETLDLCNETSPYALTGCVFARDRAAVVTAERALVDAAGNFYINDKPTGAVVGQQPFGGARASGTNDKAGSAMNLLRWVSARAIKETFDPPTDYRYPFLGAE
jgi:1-pyrroline-5-carboxylate dehydrogenase